MRLFNTPSMAHIVFSNCVGPVELIDKDAVHQDIDRLKQAIGDADPTTAFMGTISPGQIAFNYPDQHYGSHETYLGALADALSYEYKAIADAGFMLQIDSPDLAMAAHCRSVGQQRRRLAHPPAAGGRGAQRRARRDPARAGAAARLLGQLRGAPPQGRPAAEIITDVLKVNVGTIYVEGGNPRHEHEWRVFQDTKLPEDTSVILGVVDVKSNHVEHPLVIADRLSGWARSSARNGCWPAPTAGLTPSSASRSLIPTSRGSSWSRLSRARGSHQPSCSAENGWAHRGGCRSAGAALPRSRAAPARTPPTTFGEDGRHPPTARRDPPGRCRGRARQPDGATASRRSRGRCPSTLRESRRRSTTLPRPPACPPRSAAPTPPARRQPGRSARPRVRAAPLARETVIGSFVEGARVRADALTALADAVGGEPLGKTVRQLLVAKPPPLSADEPDVEDALRATYAAHERAAMLIAARLDAEEPPGGPTRDTRFVPSASIFDPCAR